MNKTTMIFLGIVNVGLGVLNGILSLMNPTPFGIFATIFCSTVGGFTIGLWIWK